MHDILSANIRNTHRIKSGGLFAGKKLNVSGHILFNVLLQRVTKPSDWSCAAPVKKHR